MTLLPAIPTWDELKEMMEDGRLSPVVRPLSDEERANARLARKSKSKQTLLKNKGEQAARQFLKTHFQAELHKNADRPQEIKGHVVRISTDVDYSGSIVLRVKGVNTPYPAKIEVKAISRWTFPLSRVSDTERKYLNQAKAANHIAAVVLVWIDGDNEAVILHFVPWKDWTTLEAGLLAKATGNFQGKSIRRVDLRDLDPYAFRKTNGRWVPDEHNILVPYLPVKQAQETVTIPLFG
jgi:hypothetical protein